MEEIGMKKGKVEIREMERLEPTIRLTGEVASVPIDKEVATRMMVKSTAFDQIKHMMNESESDAMKLAKIRDMIKTAETMMGER